MTVFKLGYAYLETIDVTEVPQLLIRRAPLLGLLSTESRGDSVAIDVFAGNDAFDWAAWRSDGENPDQVHLFLKPEYMGESAISPTISATTQKRTRRTKAQIEADNAAAAEPQLPDLSGVSTESKARKSPFKSTPVVEEETPVVEDVELENDLEETEDDAEFGDSDSGNDYDFDEDENEYGEDEAA